VEGGKSKDEISADSFFVELLIKTQPSMLWFAFLDEIDDRDSMSAEQLDWTIKFSIGLLHLSKKPFPNHDQFKIMAILELSDILRETDLATKKRRTTCFIDTFRTIIEALDISCSPQHCQSMSSVVPNKPLMVPTDSYS